MTNTSAKYCDGKKKGSIFILPFLCEDCISFVFFFLRMAGLHHIKSKCQTFVAQEFDLMQECQVMTLPSSLSAKQERGKGRMESENTYDHSHKHKTAHADKTTTQNHKP